MTDPITGCPERALEPPERAAEYKLDRLYEMYEAEATIELCLEGYKRLFPQEIKSFIDDLRTAILDYEQEDEP